MPQKQLTAAVIGTGFIGPVHVEALRRIGVHVAGILGSSAQKSRHAADQLHLGHGYRSFRELLDDQAVDVVHVTSPNRYHFQQASQLLQAGKHVLCEKPLAMDSAESSELVRIAAHMHRVAGVNYNIRYYPLCLEAAERVRRGELGDVFHVSGSYVQDWLFRDTDFNWRVLADDGGELRAVADIGTHWLDLIQFVTKQRVTAVCADLQTVHPVRRRPTGSVETFTGGKQPAGNTEAIDVTTEDAGAVLLKFDGGGRGVMAVSQVTAGRKNCLRFEVSGSKQAMQWCSERPNEMWLGQRDKANEILVKDPALLTEQSARHSSYPGGHNEGFPDTFKQLFADFYGYLGRGDFNAVRSFPTFEDGHREIVLCESILKSHRQQQWVDVTDAAC